MTIRLRLQVLAASNNAPLRNVPVQIRHDSAAKTPAFSRLLQTNKNGYALANIPEKSGKWVIDLAGKTVAKMDFDEIVAIKGAVQRFELAQKEYELLDLEAHMAPWYDGPLTVEDAEEIHDIFPDLGDGVLGSGPCEKLLPSDQIPQIFDFYNIVRTAEEVVLCEEKGAAESKEKLQLTSANLLEFQTRWDYLGLSLGHVVKSISLLPCEKVTIATSEFERDYNASAVERSDQIDGKVSILDSNQSVSEVMSAANTSFGINGSISSSVGGSIGLNLGKVVGKLIAGVSSSISGSFNHSRFRARSSRQFAERVQSSAQAWQRNRATAVYEVSESQRQSAATRVICNNNHCHTLNVFFRSIRENYKVSTTYKGQSKVILVPQEVKTFDLESALCARPFLQGSMLEPNMAECFDSLTRVVHGSEPDDGNTGDQGSKNTSRQVRLSVRIGNNGLHKRARMQIKITLKSGQVQTYNFQPGSRWRRNSSSTIFIPISVVDLTEVAKVGLRNDSNWAVTIDQLTFSFVMDDGSGIRDVATWSIGKLKKKTENHSKSTYQPAVLDDIKDPLADIDDRAQTEHDALCARALVSHLNCHKHYYNQILWLTEDVNERLCRYQRIICGKQSLADLIEPDPVAVVGCSLAFPTVDAVFEPARDDDPEDRRLIALNAPGVYADAALGQCSTCEEINEDKYWDWSKTPCNCGDASTLLTPVTPLGLPQDWFEKNADSISKLLAGAKGDAKNSLVEAFGAELAKALFKASTAGGTTQAQSLLAELIKQLAVKVSPDQDD